jgi:hypothetical protein
MSTRHLMLSATGHWSPASRYRKPYKPVATSRTSPSLQVPSLTHHHMAADAAPADLPYAPLCGKV